MKAPVKFKRVLTVDKNHKITPINGIHDVTALLYQKQILIVRKRFCNSAYGKRERDNMTIACEGRIMAGRFVEGPIMQVHSLHQNR